MVFKMFSPISNIKSVLCIALCLTLSCVVYAKHSLAQDIRIGVVDVERILAQSAAGKSIEKQLSVRRESFQKEFSARENNLMASQKNLIARKNELSNEEFAQQRKSFENQLLETRNLFKKRRRAIDKGLSTALINLRKHLVELTAEVADDKKLTVVLTRDSVVIVEKNMDITEEVLLRLNAKVPQINLNM